MSDYVIRATAAEGQIRAFAAVTRELVETARKKHDTSPVVTAALGRLLTSAAILGTQLKGEEDKLTLKIKGDGPAGAIYVVANSHGEVKGFAENPQVLLHARPDGKLDVGGAIGKGELTIIRDLGLKEPYVGTYELVSGEIAQDLTYYFAVSEQTPSAVSLGVLMNRDNTVRQSGGFIIQLMPDVTDEVTDILEEKLKKTDSMTTLLESGLSPEDILEQLLGDLDLEILEKKEVSFRCDCSRERVEKALISVGKDELKLMAEDGEDVEVGCHFCGKKYVFTADEILALMNNSI